MSAAGFSGVFDLDDKSTAAPVVKEKKNLGPIVVFGLPSAFLNPSSHALRASDMAKTVFGKILPRDIRFFEVFSISSTPVFARQAICLLR